MDSRDMCKVLETYNEGGYTDWYVPAAGQLYEFYSNKAALNEALAAISGTAFASHYYWSSSEESVYGAWLVVFNDDNVLNGGKYSSRFVRFVRDLTKPLKEKIIELEDNIPTKLSQLENDSNYIQDDVVSDGVYAVDTNGKLINYNTADSSCLGVALIAGEHKFMIAKSDATDGTSTKLYWTYNTSDLSLTNYSKVDGTNDYGYLPKPDGTFGGSSSAAHLSDDFTTWTNGALSDFNGKDNTAIIAAASSDAGEMCTVLNTFKASDSHNDWYVPACGQLALMYLNMTEINAALAKIGGTALAAELYWSSSEGSSDVAWSVRSNNGYVSYSSKNSLYRVRFVRDISVPSLKERVSELESKIKDLNTSGSSNGAYAEINHGTSDTTFTLTPNTFHVWDEVASLDLSFADETSGVANEYLFQFTSGTTATTLTLPDVKWANDTAPIIAENMVYQISILKGLASVLEFSNPIVFPIVSLSGSYPEVYSYFTTQYTFPSTSSKPSAGISISEDLYIEGDDDISGKVIKIGFDGKFLALWTENSLSSFYVLRMSSNGSTTKYFWD